MNLGKQLVISNGGADVTGDISVTGGVSSTSPMRAPDFVKTSDARLKSEIGVLDSQAAMDLVMKLRPVLFEWLKNGEKSYGLMAQDLQKLVGEAVSTGPDGYLGVNYLLLIPFLIAAIQGQQQEIERLKSTLNNR